ncbi:hypothetical protein [Longispora albida]|uniref:hypothetical protein n=1 Tax=Longispora albida TaxID=203523 RepID=UPI00035CEC25|nr:hypothetical protein [Longispora albida]
MGALSAWAIAAVLLFGVPLTWLFYRERNRPAPMYEDFRQAGQPVVPAGASEAGAAFEQASAYNASNLNGGGPGGL